MIVLIHAYRIHYDLIRDGDDDDVIFILLCTVLGDTNWFKVVNK